MTRISQLWDLIATWGFREDIQDIIADDADDNETKTMTTTTMTMTMTRRATMTRVSQLWD